jgi:UPF0716 protein FxsA
VFIKLLILFTFIPLMEFYVLLQAGQRIGAIPTIAITLLTGAVGAWLARRQGLGLLLRMQRELAAGRVPTGELLDGAMVLIGGVLLLTPGFLTDLCGLALLSPLSRQGLKYLAQCFLQRQLDQGIIIIRRR